MLCMNVLIRKRWSEEERLSYPIVQIPLAMTDPKSGFWSNRLMWIGFALAAALDGLNGLNYLYPSIPALPYRGDDLDLSRFVPDRPWNAIGATRADFYPFMIGLAFLLPQSIITGWFLIASVPFYGLLLFVTFVTINQFAGNALLVSLDFAGADGELLRHKLPDTLDPENYFRQEWVRTLFALAVEDLRSQCAGADKASHFALFERYDLDSSGAGLTYAQLADKIHLSTTQVTNYLALARAQFRQRVLERLRAATGSDEEFREEVQNLFGRNGR